MRTAQKARAIDHIGPSIDERREHLDEILRVVFEIGVLNEDVWSARERETGTKGRPLSSVLVVIENLHPGVLILLQKFASSIDRCVVDHNYFDIQTTFEHAINNFSYGSVLVVYRDNDRDRDLRKVTAYALRGLSYAGK
jgi:hypothetical protein